MNRTARRVWICLLPALLVPGVSISGAAGAKDQGFVVVVNKANPLTSLKRTQIVPIFMRKISRWPFGAEIEPIDLPDKSPVRLLFLKIILKTSADDLKAYWIDEKMTHNIDPPRRAADPAEVKKIVASKAGAIGYIPVDMADDSVKVLNIE